jgi:hypothetical protein
MKKHWLPMLFAALLMLAPAAWADDATTDGVLQDLIDQIIAIIVGDESIQPPPPSDAFGGEEPEGGHLYPPNG